MVLYANGLSRRIDGIEDVTYGDGAIERPDHVHDFAF